MKKMKRLRMVIVIMGMLGISSTVHAQRGPQDYWIAETSKAITVNGVPGYVAVDEQYLYVTRQSDDDIQVYSKTGTLVRMIGSSGSGDGLLNTAQIEVCSAKAIPYAHHTSATPKIRIAVKLLQTGL